MYQAIFLPHFRKQTKKYYKKHHDLKAAINAALNEFDRRQHDNLGHNVYKMRLNIGSLPKGKGKSFRMLIWAIKMDELLVPIAFYFKGDRDSVSKKEISDHMECILQELEDYRVEKEL